MKSRPASEVLRRHAVERFLRGAIRSALLDGDAGAAVHRMSHAEWVDSCQLVAGVDPITLDLLGVYYCLELPCGCARVFRWADICPHQRWDAVLVDIQGEAREVRKEKAARRHTLVSAGAVVGLEIDHDQARKRREAAISQIQDNQVRRADALAHEKGGRSCAIL